MEPNRTIRSIVLTTPLMISVAACGNSLLATRATNPVITDYQSRDWLFGAADYGVISTTAGRRSIFIYYPRQTPKEKAEGVTPASKVCAEAPPDAVDAFANAIAGKADANVSYPNSITAGGSVSLGQSFAVSSGLGIYRSQGLQVLRDQSFGLCVLLAQGIINSSEWQAEHEAILKTAKELVEKEEPAILEAAKRPAMVVAAPSVSSPLPADNPQGQKQQNNTQAQKQQNNTQAQKQQDNPQAQKQQIPAANNPPTPPQSR